MRPFISQCVLTSQRPLTKKCVLDRINTKTFSNFYRPVADIAFRQEKTAGMIMLARSSLLGEMETSIRAETHGRVEETLRRVTDLFLTGAEHYTDQQIALFDEVFSRLVEKIEARALAELSDRLAPMPNAPASVMRRLASDNSIAVAAPALSQSAVLSGTDLAAIAETKSQDHLLVISRRDGLEANVSDILIDRGNTDVLHSLVSNASAAISDSGYTKLIDKTPADDTLAELVAARNDISLPGLRRLLKRATRDVHARLVRRVNPEFKRDVHEALLRIFDRVDNDIHRERDSALSAIQILADRNLLDQKKVFELCRSQQLAQVTAGLSRLSTASFELVAEILDSGRNHPLMVLCKAAGFQWSTTFAILKSRPHQHDIVEFQFDQLLADYCRISPAIAQRALRFWEARLSEKPARDETIMDMERPQRHPRSSPRSKIHQAAVILGPNNFETSCTMLDISRGGAKLQIPAAVNVPDRFVLTLARNRLIRRNCTVMWRAKDGPAERVFGVSFDH